jgi:hypothetical protein
VRFATRRSRLLSHWPIRYKLFFGVVTLSLIVAILSFSGFSGAYAFRRLARSISQRAVEMPAAAELTRSVRELRLSFRQNRPLQDIPSRAESNPSYVRGQFRTHFLAVQRQLEENKRQLEATRATEPLIGDLRPELQTVREIERTLAQIEQINSDQAWVLDQVQLDLIGDKLVRLNDLTDQLPRHLQQRMITYRDDVRMQYRTWIVLTWFTSILSAVLLIGLAYLQSGDDGEDGVAGSSFPAPSIAHTSKTCEPTDNDEAGRCGEEHAPADSPSNRQRNTTPDLSATNSNVGRRSLVSPDGPPVIDRLFAVMRMISPNPSVTTTAGTWGMARPSESTSASPLAA